MLSGLRSRALASCGSLPLARGLASAAGRVTIGSDQAKRKRLPQKAALELTESAAKRIVELLERRREQEPAIAVRIGVKTRGCNGYVVHSPASSQTITASL